MKLKDREIYGIINLATGEPWETPKGKWAWQGVGQAKNAFITHNYPKYRAGCFDEPGFQWRVVFLGELKWEPYEYKLQPFEP